MIERIYTRGGKTAVATSFLPHHAAGFALLTFSLSFHFFQLELLSSSRGHRAPLDSQYIFSSLPSFRSFFIFIILYRNDPTAGAPPAASEMHCTRPLGFFFCLLSIYIFLVAYIFWNIPREMRRRKYGGLYPEICWLCDLIFVLSRAPHEVSDFLCCILLRQERLVLLEELSRLQYSLLLFLYIPSSFKRRKFPNSGNQGAWMFHMRVTVLSTPFLLSAPTPTTLEFSITPWNMNWSPTSHHIQLRSKDIQNELVRLCFKGVFDHPSNWIRSADIYRGESRVQSSVSDRHLLNISYTQCVNGPARYLLKHISRFFLVLSSPLWSFYFGKSRYLTNGLEEEEASGGITCNRVSQKAVHLPLFLRCRDIRNRV
jgi:hypothetical protein